MADNTYSGLNSPNIGAVVVSDIPAENITIHTAFNDGRQLTPLELSRSEFADEAEKVVADFRGRHGEAGTLEQYEESLGELDKIVAGFRETGVWPKYREFTDDSYANRWWQEIIKKVLKQEDERILANASPEVLRSREVQAKVTEAVDEFRSAKQQNAVMNTLAGTDGSPLPTAEEVLASKQQGAWQNSFEYDVGRYGKVMARTGEDELFHVSYPIPVQELLGDEFEQLPKTFTFIEEAEESIAGVMERIPELRETRLVESTARLDEATVAREAAYSERERFFEEIAPAVDSGEPEMLDARISSSGFEQATYLPYRRRTS